MRLRRTSRSKDYLSSFYLYTKMRNVGGIAQTEAMKSSDLFMKCRYLDELTGGRTPQGVRGLKWAREHPSAARLQKIELDNFKTYFL